MAPKVLVDKDIESGKRLIEKLDELGVQVDAALWAYDSESDRYQLVVASGTVADEGVRPLFGSIQDALKQLPEGQRVRFSDVAVASPSTGVVAILATRYSTPPGAIDSIRVTDSVVNRELVEDAYIYRLSVCAAPSSTPET